MPDEFEQEPRVPDKPTEIEQPFNNIQATNSEGAVVIDAVREANEQRWESQAATANSERPFYKKALGRGEITGSDIMRDEAERINESVDKTREIPRDRAESPYTELAPEKVEDAKRLLTDLYREVLAVELQRAKDQDAYKAPELNRGSAPEFAALMLKQLIDKGRLNYWDASIDISNQYLGGTGFSTERDADNLLAAIDRIKGELGLEDKNLPAGHESSPPAAVLEYELTDMNGRSLGKKRVELTGTLEQAQEEALSAVVAAEWSGGASLLVKGAMVKLPDGKEVSWQEFTNPVLERQRNQAA